MSLQPSPKLDAHLDTSAGDSSRAITVATRSGVREGVVSPSVASRVLAAPSVLSSEAMARIEALVRSAVPPAMLTTMVSLYVAGCGVDPGEHAVTTPSLHLPSLSLPSVSDILSSRYFWYFLVAMGVVVVLKGLRIVPAGSSAIVFNKLTGSTRDAHAGLRFLIPWVDEFIDPDSEGGRNFFIPRAPFVQQSLVIRDVNIALLDKNTVTYGLVITRLSNAEQYNSLGKTEAARTAAVRTRVEAAVRAVLSARAALLMSPPTTTAVPTSAAFVASIRGDLVQIAADVNAHHLIKELVGMGAGVLVTDLDINEPDALVAARTRVAVSDQDKITAANEGESARLRTKGPLDAQTAAVNAVVGDGLTRAVAAGAVFGGSGGVQAVQGVAAAQQSTAVAGAANAVAAAAPAVAGAATNVGNAAGRAFP
ncbi:hypothetical protein KA517_02070 [Candidatus Gracilibacteria bacterium]|nr:hypothetical protein [Candidatus Gracilibacteria bacterium]